MIELPDGSGCFTATIMSKDEAMSLPLKERPLNYRLSSDMYHAVFEAVGHASVCWNPRPSNEVFDASEAEKCAVDLCFKIANEIEKAVPTWQPIDTAPKNGTEVLVGWHFKRGFYQNQEWQDRGLGWDQAIASWGREHWRDQGRSLSGCPTHWMPLPPAPSDAP